MRRTPWLRVLKLGLSKMGVLLGWGVEGSCKGRSTVSGDLPLMLNKKTLFHLF